MSQKATECLDSTVCPFTLCQVRSTCMFRCNLPPALLADWQGSFTCRLAGVFYLQTGRGLLPADWQRSFTCYSSHMGRVGGGGNRYKNQSAQKADSGEEHSPAAPAWGWTCESGVLPLTYVHPCPYCCVKQGKKSEETAEWTALLTCMASNLACLAFSSLALFLSSCRCCWSSCTTADCRSTSSLFCCSSRRIAASPACRRFWCRLNHSWIFVAAVLRVLRYCSAALRLACTSGRSENLEQERHSHGWTFEHVQSHVKCCKHFFLIFKIQAFSLGVEGGSGGVGVGVGGIFLTESTESALLIENCMCLFYNSWPDLYLCVCIHTCTQTTQ